MADQFQSGMCSGNWWNASSRTGLHGSESLPCLSSINSIGNFPASSCDESVSASDSSVVYQSQGSDSVSGGGSGGGNTVLMDSTLQMMGFHLSSPKMDWNQDILHGDSSPAFKQINQDFSLDQNRLSSETSSDACIVTCQSIPASFSMDSVPYGYQTTFFQGLLQPDLQPSQPSYENYPFQASYGINTSDQSSHCWQNFPQQTSNNQLHLSNKGPSWNPSAASMTSSSSRSRSLPPLQNHQNLAQNFEEKPSCSSYSTLKTKPNEVGDSLGSTVKKGNSEPAIKRPRVETPSPLPTFKVRKEKLGDRITTLQQLVSPFGKTDTASVLFEAIEYIKFLHEQVSVLSAPYMKNGSPIQHHKRTGDVKDGEGREQDLRSRGLCLVPMTSIFPVTNETNVDFWTPTFGGTYR